ncbi:MAG: RNase J family beta-CASP ribonuclease [Clostridia bacterium]|nr:RNase J family beta-CASP ribonuclease [Clostridia bacterium]
MTDKQLKRVLEAVKNGNAAKPEAKAESKSRPQSAKAEKSKTEKNKSVKAKADKTGNDKAKSDKIKSEKGKKATAAPKRSPAEKAGRTNKRSAPLAEKSKKRRAEAVAPVAAPTHKRKGQKGRAQKLRVMILGGLEEIGKNIAVLEYGEDMIAIDCGMGFPDEDMLGIDLVIPDFTYLEKNAHKFRALFLTHGHEDHIGGVPYLLRVLSPTVYGTRLTVGILKKKLEEFRYESKPKLQTVEAGDTVRAGAFSVEFIHVNHSIADACALAIHTPVGTVVHSGDFKLDVSPIDGNMMDLTRLGTLGREGVSLLLCESTNAERPGYTPSERKVGGSLEQIFNAHKGNRLIIATFSSNVHRVQQIIDASVRHGRRVAVVGRSMLNVTQAASELGYMDIPEGTLIDTSEMKRFRPEQITLITTGSQGEPMSALYRMAFSEHDRVKLTPEDVVVLSATAIPGNEKLVGKIINALVAGGVKVISDPSLGVHVSGHACQEELKLFHALTKPKYFMPVHGEARHLYAHKEIAEFMGMPSRNIFIASLGRVLELDENGAAFADTVPAGNTLVDGSGIGDVGSVVLRDRKHLSEDGLIVAVVSVDTVGGLLLSGPDIVSRGFVYVKESSSLMEDAKTVAREAAEACLGRGRADFMQIKTAMKEALSRFFFKQTKRKPMILPIVMEI